MNIWRRHSTTVKRLGAFRQTRLWSKDVALKKILGLFNNPTGALFTEALTTLNAIIDNEEIHAIVKTGCLETSKVA